MFSKSREITSCVWSASTGWASGPSRICLYEWATEKGRRLQRGSVAPICWSERIDREAMARQFCPMAIGSIPGFHCKRSWTDEESARQIVCLVGAVHDDAPDRIDRKSVAW